jgi:acyl carrier protein
MTTLEELNAVLCEVLDDPDLVIREEMTAQDVECWDSLSHVNLIVAVEIRFGIKFSQKELMALRNVGDLVSIIEKKTSPSA